MENQKTRENKDKIEGKPKNKKDLTWEQIYTWRKPSLGRINCENKIKPQKINIKDRKQLKQRKKINTERSLEPSSVQYTISVVIFFWVIKG